MIFKELSSNDETAVSNRASTVHAVSYQAKCFKNLFLEINFQWGGVPALSIFSCSFNDFNPRISNMHIKGEISWFSNDILSKTVNHEYPFHHSVNCGRLSVMVSRAGAHKPRHFPLPCQILAFLSSRSHKPQSFGLLCPHISVFRQAL